MKEMLDLQKLTQETYEIKWIDGTVLHLCKPTQGTLTKFVEIMQMEDETWEKQLSKIYKVVTDCFNNNLDEFKVTKKEIESIFNINTLFVFIEDYLSEITKILGE